ncbi:hypothetical protein ACTXT7_014002 [Hymenolepis weldensis]
MFNSLSVEVKAHSAKFDGSKYVDASITSMSSVCPSYSNKQSESVEIHDPVAAEDVTKNISEFIHDPKKGKFFESWYKNNYMFTVNLAKWNEKTIVSHLVRKLSFVEYKLYSKLFILKKFVAKSLSVEVKVLSAKIEAKISLDISNTMTTIASLNSSKNSTRSPVVLASLTTDQICRLKGHKEGRCTFPPLRTDISSIKVQSPKCPGLSKHKPKLIYRPKRWAAPWSHTDLYLAEPLRGISSLILTQALSNLIISRSIIQFPSARFEDFVVVLISPIL